MALVALACSMLLAAGSAVAHKAAATPEEARMRREFVADAQDSLKHCGDLGHLRAIDQASYERRLNWYNSLRAERGLAKRDVETVLRTDHKSNLTGVTPGTPSDVFFANNTVCVLQPKVTEGPYSVSNELVRQDLRDGEPGIDLYVDMQFIDVKTCQIVTDFYVDFWHCNATGVYSGVVANGNGNSKDTENAKRNFHRGVYPVDDDGVVQFTTTYPGHYTGRTNHIHIKTNKVGTLNADGTYYSTSATQIGQIFFDQGLTTLVNTVAPYTTNTQKLTTNANDGIFREEAATSDPVVNYVFLGDSVADGIFSWVRVGVNMDASYTFRAANKYDPNA